MKVFCPLSEIVARALLSRPATQGFGMYPELAAEVVKYEASVVVSDDVVTNVASRVNKFV